VSHKELEAEEARMMEQAVQASLDEMVALQAVAALSSSTPPTSTPDQSILQAPIMTTTPDQSIMTTTSSALPSFTTSIASATNTNDIAALEALHKDDGDVASVSTLTEGTITPHGSGITSRERAFSFDEEGRGNAGSGRVEGGESGAGGGGAYQPFPRRPYAARFIRDKTIPDGTVLPPRTRINKTW